LQPVHNMGSSGYSSHGSNSSHGNGKTIENRNVVDEPGKSKPRTFQEICKRVHMLKSQDQPVYFPSPSKPESRETTDRAQQHKSPVAFLKDSAVPPLLVKDSTAIAAASVEELTCNDQTVYSYQQISCLDSVIRYLESCITPVTVKRKYQFSSYTAFSMHASRL
ncbi:period circadian protein homolog 2-like, partial [Salvelinus namaycush]|uniref:Period circadian protein homolog 2-like n=1 Tax=Salvelinus namaycush TaxID=8040 RepID=A0A8U0TUG2_SALNM